MLPCPHKYPGTFRPECTKLEVDLAFPVIQTVDDRLKARLFGLRSLSLTALAVLETYTRDLEM